MGTIYNDDTIEVKQNYPTEYEIITGNVKVRIQTKTNDGNIWVDVTETTHHSGVVDCNVNSDGTSDVRSMVCAENVDKLNLLVNTKDGEFYVEVEEKGIKKIKVY